jgi:hypothetical protein
MQSSSGRRVCRRKATTIASSWTESTVECGALDPVGRSAVASRFLHLATVLGLMPWRSAKALKLA